MDTIKWGDILAETGNYRDGFVAIFRKYEGQPTDEVVRGKTIKVTVNSFAAHMGIEERTFRRWIDKASGLDSAPNPRSKNDLTRDVTRAARHEPEAVVAGIEAAPQEAQDAILAGLVERRMPFGGAIPKVPGEDRPIRKSVEIGSLCANILATLGVLEVKLAEATVDEIDEVASSLATVNHRAVEVTGPFVPSADTVEQFLRDRTV